MLSSFAQKTYRLGLEFADNIPCRGTIPLFKKGVSCLLTVSDN